MSDQWSVSQVALVYSDGLQDRKTALVVAGVAHIPLLIVQGTSIMK